MSNQTDKSVASYYGPSQTALLLLDYHTFLVDMLGDKADAAVKVAANMRTWAKSLGIQVIHCLLDTTKEPPETSTKIELFNTVLASMNSSGKHVEPQELVKGDDDITYLRRPGHVSALSAPGMTAYLEAKEIKSLILLGISTSACVMRTASAATDSNFVVSVISDGCADRDDDMHEAMLGKVLSFMGSVATSKEFQDSYSKAH